MHNKSENQLENKFINYLQTNLNYEYLWNNLTVEDLEQNFKKQLEKINNIKLTDKDFKKVKNYLNWNNIYDNFVKLRTESGRFLLENKKQVNIKFFEKDWCKNTLQVTNQVNVKWKWKNRYDVTILVNWLPLIQVELKRYGNGLKEAFNQIKRYKNESYEYSYLFQQIQLFIISDGNDTKYFSNEKTDNLIYENTFHWTDENNNKIKDLLQFSDIFLKSCFISNFIFQYMTLNQTEKRIFILRPYQYYAINKILEKVEKNSWNWYIWHTTWSWKTLTSFKTSQLLAKNNDIFKIIFVVDRKDLDKQTQEEFEKYSSWSVDYWTDNTNKLKEKLINEDSNKLVITTIQKIDRLLKKEQNNSDLKKIKDKRIVFIFDEAHRSTFWNTMKKIINYFTNSQRFWFTWTPIFADNNKQGETTETIFWKPLHKYTIIDAIDDWNVLRFLVEYVWFYKIKNKETLSTNVNSNKMNYHHLY